VDKSAPELKAIFGQALELDSPADRARYIAAACGADAGLRREVESLLKALEGAGSFLESPAATFTVTGARAPIAEGAGTVIGPYKLLEPIGEGGFGVVFMAEQAKPVRRKVALKIIKPGMDTKQVIARFEAERQALALMDHPNIAKVHDAGATESGRPYFVMELVRGIPITEYCDRERLSIPERLELFIQVCRAVQHAHQKGIIHRDLKPSNILVTIVDGAAVPKIIDFGVAKAMGQQLTEKTLFTGLAQLIGTPLYMSPEQAEFSGVDVDTRSDIYSLGVLLYELLTGTTPFEAGTFRTVGYDAIRRIIREEEPPRPSTRVRTLAGTATTISANRQTDPRRLRKSLRGELDWIVMRALEKDRSRRYETVGALAADLRRYLDHQPVEAGPPSAWYRLRKFVRRNRAALATAAVVMAALVAGTAASTWEAIEASQERNRADLARREADRRATEAREVVDYLINDLIGAASPSRAQGKVPTVDQVLAQADGNIAQRFAGRPLIEASIRHALGQAYEELGQYPKAERHAARAVELRLAHLGPEHADTIAAQNALARALERQGQNQKARALLTLVLATARTMLGPEHQETLHSMHVLAEALYGLCKYDEARAVHEELLAIQKRVLGPEHLNTLTTMHNLARDWQILGNLEQAKLLHEQALAVALRGQPNHAATFLMMENLAEIYSSLRQFDRALDLRRRAVDGCVRVLGLAHPYTRRAIGYYFSSTRKDRIHWEQTRKDLEAILDRSRRVLGPEAKITFSVTAICLALLLREQGRFAEARPLLEQTLAEASRLSKEDPLLGSPDNIERVRDLAQFLLGRWPGLAPGISPAERPPASFTIEAPFRAVSPVADGRIAPDEYGPGIEVRFDDDANPGRLYAWGQSRSKKPDDLSVRVHAAHTDRSLFLAFLVRDQFVDASERDARTPRWNDSVEIFIDADHVANDMPPGLLFQFGQRGNREGFHLAADAGGHQCTVGEGLTNADWKAGTSRTPDGYLVEFEIPLALIDTRDGPELVPASSGSELRVNFGIIDNDDAQTSGQTDYGIFWAEDPNHTPYTGGEDFWTVSLRLVPKPAGP
jgi:serine/threonine protein kinase/tetratricopeptide (TPR) repeat protein